MHFPKLCTLFSAIFRHLRFAFDYKPPWSVQYFAQDPRSALAEDAKRYEEENTVHSSRNSKHTWCIPNKNFPTGWWDIRRFPHFLNWNNTHLPDRSIWLSKLIYFLFSACYTGCPKQTWHNLSATKNFRKIWKILDYITAILHLKRFFMYIWRTEHCEAQPKRKLVRMEGLLAFSTQQKAKRVTWYHRTGSILQTQRNCRNTYAKSPPAPDYILRWDQNWRTWKGRKGTSVGKTWNVIYPRRKSL